ncbi:MAG: CxxxxCH/CxxCH domain-containing protein [Desulfuromonadaceae bacterium]|nr:CxxxxCH/CxxCH domain-containing protein [Desulfuromonadaceae bacterium]
MGYIRAQKIQYPHLISGFLMLAFLLFNAGSANAAVINQCNDCHGMPPKDSVRKGNPHFRSYSSATVGSHQKHLGATPVANDCVVCHGAVVTTFDHQNEIINMASPISGGSYGKGVFLNQTSIPLLNATARCSNVTCHADPYSAGTVTTPIWGTAAANCSACHTTPIGATGPATGSHTTVSGHAVSCTTCHTSGTTATSMPSSGHIDTNVTVVNVGYPATVAKHAPGSGYSSCSAATCHASPVAAALITTPLWGSTGNGCAACHIGANAITPTGPATGSHAKHNVTDCSQCHTGATTNTAVPTLNHADGNIDVANGYPANVAKHAAGSYTGTCSTASCHADVYGPGLITTPVWGTTATNCSACHTTPIVSTGPATGSHAIHNITDCSQCHAGATTSTTIPTLNHIDGNIDVTNGYPANVTKHTAASGYGGRSCSTAVCHGASSPVWGANTANATCTKCHGTPSVSATNANMAPAIGAHQVHVRGTGTNNYSRELTCFECHNSGTSITFTNHMNGNTQNVVFTNASTAQKNGVVASWTAGTYPDGTCAVYCHGANMPKGDTSGTARTPSWTASTLMNGTLLTDCGTCHGNPPAAGSTATTHSGKTPTTSCTGCHSHFNATGGFDTEANRRLHIDGILQATGNCDSCHGYGVGTWAAAPVINPEGKGAHEKHIVYLTTKRFTVTLAPATDAYAGATAAWTNVCGICHGNTAANHRNSTVNVSLDQTYLFGTSPTLAQYNGTPGISSGTAGKEKTCSNISCHYFTTPVWSTY